MSQIEPYLVELIQQLSRMRIPISVAEGLLLANSLISGTETKKILDQWREKHSMPFRLNKKRSLEKDIGGVS